MSSQMCRVVKILGTNGNDIKAIKIDLILEEYEETIDILRDQIRDFRRKLNDREAVICDLRQSLTDLEGCE